MSTTLLRTLTLKSQLKFGRYGDITVSSMLNLGNRDRLAWYYYNCSNISFSEEVLTLIGIKPEERIPKPGKNDAAFKKWNDAFFFHLTPKEFERLMNRNKAERQRRLKWENISNNRSKKVSQTFNQGYDSRMGKPI